MFPLLAASSLSACSFSEDTPVYPKSWAFHVRRGDSACISTVNPMTFFVIGAAPPGTTVRLVNTSNQSAEFLPLSQERSVDFSAEGYSRFEASFSEAGDFTISSAPLGPEKCQDGVFVTNSIRTKKAQIANIHPGTKRCILFASYGSPDVTFHRMLRPSDNIESRCGDREFDIFRSKSITSLMTCANEVMFVRLNTSDDEGDRQLSFDIEVNGGLDPRFEVLSDQYFRESRIAKKKWFRTQNVYILGLALTLMIALLLCGSCVFSGNPNKSTEISSESQALGSLSAGISSLLQNMQPILAEDSVLPIPKDAQL